MHTTMKDRVLGTLKEGKSLTADDIALRIKHRDAGRVLVVLNSLIVARKVVKDAKSQLYRLNVRNQN